MGGKEGQIGAEGGKVAKNLPGIRGWVDFCRHATDVECEVRRKGICKKYSPTSAAC